jgi:hypothetical protein
VKRIYSDSQVAEALAVVDACGGNVLFRIDESKNIELRAEFFNLFNHVNLANPISNFNAVPPSGIRQKTGRIIDPGDFGRINSTSNNPRLIQFALRFNY